MSIIPTYAQTSSEKSNVKITPTSSGSLQVVLAKVMNVFICNKTN